MKFSVRNLGPIREADLEIGDLTIVCGANNNGKTYLAYALDSFLDTVDRNLAITVSDSLVESLFSRGECRLDLDGYVGSYVEAINDGMPDFTRTLDRFLAMHPDRFSETKIVVPITTDDVRKKFAADSFAEPRKRKLDYKITENTILRFEKMSNLTNVSIRLLNKSTRMPARGVVKNIVEYVLARLINDSAVNSVFPRPFIITCERTGVALFRTELFRVRDRMSHESFDPYEDFTAVERFNKLGYQRPVGKDIAFVLDLKTVVLRKSYLSEYHPDVMEDFSDIAGGVYSFELDSNEIKFKPRGVNVTLSLAESSSTVRSLAELYFYLAHKAQRGQLLMFDEPEINLHPENQRKLARLLAKLVRLGIKVLITTHSDYIVREINALLMLSSLNCTGRRKVLAQFHIQESCLLDQAQLKCFVLKNGFLYPINRDESGGFSMFSFDEAVSDYMSLHHSIVQWKLAQRKAK